MNGYGRQSRIALVAPPLPNQSGAAASVGAAHPEGAEEAAAADPGGGGRPAGHCDHGSVFPLGGVDDLHGIHFSLDIYIQTAFKFC